MADVGRASLSLSLSLSLSVLHTRGRTDALSHSHCLPPAGPPPVAHLVSLSHGASLCIYGRTTTATLAAKSIQPLSFELNKPRVSLVAARGKAEEETRGRFAKGRGRPRFLIFGGDSAFDYVDVRRSCDCKPNEERYGNVVRRVDLHLSFLRTRPAVFYAL
jgi:hypothetical protein